MIVFGFYALLVANIFLVFLKKNSKIVSIISIVFSVYIYFVSTGAADFDAYKGVYDGTISMNTFEIGYNFLMKIGHLFKWDYLIFQGVICTLCLIISLTVFHRFSKNFQLFFSLYFMYQFFYDLVVIRNHICFTILVIALLFLLRGKRFTYLFWIMVAVLFHRSALFYIPIVFINFNSKKTIRVMECLAIIILIVSCLLYLVSSQSDVLFRLAQKLPFISEDKLGYFNRSVHLGFIPHFMLHFGTLFIYIVFGPHRYSKQSLYFDVKYMRLYTLCYVINLYALLCFPMIIYNLTFFRLFNGLYLFNYIFYAVTLEKYKKRGGYKTMLAWILFVNGLYILPWVHASGQRTAILNSIVKK